MGQLNIPPTRVLVDTVGVFVAYTICAIDNEGTACGDKPLRMHAVRTHDSFHRGSSNTNLLSIST